MPKGTGSPGVLKVLSVLVYLHDIIHLEDVPKDRVMKTAEINSSTFPSMISRMVKKGLIEYGSSSSGTIKITDMGREEAPDDHEFPTSNEEHHQKLLEKLKGKPKKIFKILMDGQPHRKMDIMQAVDCMNPKTFAPLLSRELKKPGYIIYPGKDLVQLSDECYPCPRE